MKSELQQIQELEARVAKLEQKKGDFDFGQQCSAATKKPSINTRPGAVIAVLDMLKQRI